VRLVKTAATFLALTLSLLAAPAASAVVTISNGGLGSGSVNLESDGSGDTIHLRCQGGRVQSDAGGGTFNVDLGPCGDLQLVTAEGNGGADTIDFSTMTPADFPGLAVPVVPDPIIVDGGTGADTITGSQLGDLINATTHDPTDPIVSAGGGDDTIDGGGSVFAGTGDDLVTGNVGGGPIDLGPGDDVSMKLVDNEAGGPGTDSVDIDASDVTPASDVQVQTTVTDASLTQVFTVGANPPASLAYPWNTFERLAFKTFNGGSNTVDSTGFSGVVDVEGGLGVETLLGGPGEDFLSGGGNNDVIDGGGGFDYVQGGEGDDQLRLRDNGADRGICGDGSDSVVADAADALTDCESVDLPAVAPPPDTSAPDTSGLTGPKKVKKGKAATFSFSATESGSTFMCAIDANPFAPCGSPDAVKTKSLKPGSHLFSVFATDAAGNSDASAARATFTVAKKKKKKPRK
jgi:hypothetical protein